MSKSFPKPLFFVLLAFFLGACGTARMESKPKELPPASLRVGVYPYYPPMIFKENNEVRGAEADLGVLLAKALGRQADFFELSWDRLIPALMEKKIDIIMSGMTITEARKARVNFTDPYVKIGQAALMRAEDASQFNSLKSIRESFSTIGVVKGTTGEVFVRNNFTKAANIISLQKANEASYALINKRIDLFVHDGPSVAWLVSENEGVLKGYWGPFTEEYLGWAVNREDQDLLTKINSILSEWKKDGTLKEVLTHWLPYWKNFD
jgi:polar amino acid transport system substrate-binding protein